MQHIADLRGPVAFDLPAAKSQPERASTILHSFRCSFGSAVVTGKVPREDAAIWEEGLKNAAHDHRYYELTHEALKDQFSHYYLLLKDSAGATRAIQPFFIVNQDILVGMPRFIAGIMAKIRVRFPSALKLRTLMVGCSAGEGQLPQVNPTLGSSWLVSALGEVLPYLARKLKAELVVFKDFPKTERPKLGELSNFGFKRIASMPATQLTLNYKSFDHYLETALSAKTRKDLRRKFRKAAGRLPIEMEVVHDVRPFIDEIFPLYEQVVQKSKLKFEVLTRAYFTSISETMPDRAIFFLWRQENRIVAFNSCIAHQGMLRDNYVGFDYNIAHDQHLYFTTRRDIFAWAIEHGFHTYSSAPLNYDPKLHLRQTLSPLDLFTRTTRSWINPFFHLLLPLMEPTRYDPIIKRFGNAHELD